jgi:hypothetical protein
LLSILHVKLRVEPTIYKENRASGLPGSIPFYTRKANNANVTLAQHKPNYDWLTSTYTSNAFNEALQQSAQARARADAALAPQKQREEAERNRKRRSDI